MRQVPTKNYFILLGLVIVTVVVTIALGNFYTNRNRETSVLYNVLPKVTLSDLDTYLLENDVAAVYIADKYDLDDEKEEKKLRNKLVELNLINNFVYLDSNSIDDNFKDEFNNKYHYQLTDDYPTIIVISNRRVINSYKSLNVEKINFEELK